MVPLVPRAFFRCCLVLTAIMALGLACSKSKQDNSSNPSTASSAKITGKVTYSRIPLVVDGTGKPTGLQTDPSKFLTLPARRTLVRLWTAQDETSSTGAVTHPWRVSAVSYTDVTDGSFTFNVTYPAGTEAFVELVSALSIVGDGPIRLVADPAGIDSQIPQSDRQLYILRKGVAGKLPDAAAIPADKLTGDATVNFDIGQTTSWWLNSDLSNETALQQAVKEPAPTGSRVLGILDSLADVSINLARPSLSSTLDLHYRPGRSHARGTFVEYDRARRPLAYSPNGWHFFGSVRGDSHNDDAWDAGVLAFLVGQNMMYASHAGPWAYVQPKDPWGPDAGQELANLHPSVAFQQAAAQALAATAMRSPYLADTQAAGGPRVLDIRDRKQAPQDVFSALNLRALAWEMILKASSLPSPGGPADWAKLNYTAANRFFTLANPSDTTGKPTDVPTVFSQLARLKEDKGTTEVVDLKAIFTDSVITALAQPFGIPWPRPTTGPMASFLADWGTDFVPIAGQPVFSRTLTLSMADAVPDATGLYPNASKGETVHALYSTSKDQAYFLNVAPLPPHGAKLEVRMAVYNPVSKTSGMEVRTFDENTSPDPKDPIKRVVFWKLNVDTTTNYQYVTVHLVSPNDKVPDYTFTLTLTPAP